MRVLFVTARPPQLDGTADQITTYKAIEYLETCGHEIEVYVGSTSEERNIFFFIKVLISLLYGLINRMPVQVCIYKDRNHRDEIKKRIDSKRFDIIYAHLIRSMGLIPKTYWSQVHLGMQISQFVNLSRVAQNGSIGLSSLFYFIEAQLCRSFERKIIQKCRMTNLVSKVDFDKLKLNGVRVSNISFIPHGVDNIEGAVSNINKKFDFIFLGNFATETNKDALRFLLEQVWPKIREISKLSTLAVAGRNLEQSLFNVNMDGITILGEVHNAIETTSLAWVSVNPVRAAAGMQNKVLTALAANCHVVATEVSVEGMNIPDELLERVTTDPSSFAEKCISTLAKSKSSKNNIRAEFVKQNWSWDVLHDKWFSEFLSK